MAREANYKITARAGGWVVEHDGEVSSPYETREAAFEATLGPASNAIKLGHAISITVAPSGSGKSALGAD
jgi:hypothetical protein